MKKFISVLSKLKDQNLILMNDWDLLIEEAKNENQSKNDHKETEVLDIKESNRDFEFGDALEESKKKKVESSMKNAEVDPLKIIPNQKVEKLETAGEGWFNMPKAEITPELKRDWDILRMRSVFRSGADLSEMPENPPDFIQVGVIKDNPIEGAKRRVGKKHRGKTIAEALAKDAEFRDFLERKYQKLVSKKKKH